MFNQYLEMTEDNYEIIMANAIIENLKFLIISLDIIFNQKTNETFFYEEYTFYFYHLQNALTSCGNIINVFTPNSRFYKERNERALYLQNYFKIDRKKYTCLFDKSFRNANEHFDDRYDYFKGRAGDYSVVGKRTEPTVRDAILNSPHIRTLDTEKWLYITYDKSGNKIVCNLRQLREEAYDLLFTISSHPKIANSTLTHIPTKKII